MGQKSRKLVSQKWNTCIYIKSLIRLILMNLLIVIKCWYGSHITRWLSWLLHFFCSWMPILINEKSIRGSDLKAKKSFNQVEQFNKKT